MNVYILADKILHRAMVVHRCPSFSFVWSLVFVLWCVGFAAGGDPSEAEPERPNPPAGGGEEHFAGAAGGGGGGTTQPGETAAVGAGSGTFVDFFSFFFTNSSRFLAWTWRHIYIYTHAHAQLQLGHTQTYTLRFSFQVPLIFDWVPRKNFSSCEHLSLMCRAVCKQL